MIEEIHEVTMMLTPMEYKHLTTIRYPTFRCKNCGHLSVLHNGHCCSFCTVEDCECKESQYND